MTFQHQQRGAILGSLMVWPCAIGHRGAAEYRSFPFEPLAVTFRTASQLTGLGATTLWKYAKERRILLIRPPGLRRTLIDFPSLKKLLEPRWRGQ
jgi:hypothetical protein